jgi:hypothetical protein
MKVALACALAIASVTMAFAQDKGVAARTEAPVAQLHYSGPCACPDNQMSNANRRCGRVSAYCRCGGHEPICFEGDNDPERRVDNMIRHCGHRC